MLYFCCDNARRNQLAGNALNGIDYVEVLDGPRVPLPQRQRTLFVHFINPLTGLTIAPGNVSITGGVRIVGIAVTGATIGTGDQANVLSVTVDQPGDFSTYTLQLVDAPENSALDVAKTFDRMFRSVGFSFKVACPTDFDCQPVRVCPPSSPTEPVLDYLSKDYNSFRQLMLDRIAILSPSWQERNPADLGMALVETLAYVGDQLSYHQDSIASEAYLETARSRISARRHARLVDYSVHDGCNARAWVEVRIASSSLTLKAGTELLTLAANAPATIVPGSDAQTAALAAGSTTFETMHDATFFVEHNEIRFYTWGDGRCCLPAGATAATLAGPLPNLKPGMVLVIEERLGPRTGSADDADPSRRCAVRLTSVAPAPGQSNVDPLTKDPIVDVTWAADDALPFAFSISSVTDAEEGSLATPIADVSVARANVVLADHGRTVVDTPGEPTLDRASVPQPSLFRLAAAAPDPCSSIARVAVPPRFRPKLTFEPLTFAAPFDPAASVAASMRSSADTLLPSIALSSIPEPGSSAAPERWRPQQHLLNSAANAAEFVVETESDGTAWLRFGDNQHGLRPDPATTFSATYRIGNGGEGNVPAEAIAHVVGSDPGLSIVQTVRNPLPAQGGIDGESIEEIRRSAPSAFRTQVRAVTADDYASLAGSYPGVQRAVATLRWTGSWKTVYLTVDRQGGLPADDAFREGLRAYIERFRLAGHDLEVESPNVVSLEIDLTVCVEPDYFRSNVEAAALAALGNANLADGSRGLFHPDNFTFGQPVYLSAVYGAVQRLPGVASAVVTAFGRQSGDLSSALASGFVEIERLEVARLDNDPNYPDHGVLRLTTRGGK